VPLVAVFTMAGNCGAIQINDLVVVASNTAAPVPADVPMGQGATQTSLLPEDAVLADDNVFGSEGGYFHPYINIYGEFSDNVYNSNVNETDSLLTRVSPGIWFALPRKKIIPISLAPHNTSPGGLQNQLQDRTTQDRYTSYALLGGDYKIYSEDSDLNDFDWVAEGSFRYNMRGGLSLQVVDRYTNSEDKFGTETIGREDNRPRFNSNFFMATADWEMTEKLRLQADYSNFYVDYDEELEAYKNRVDNGIDLYGYFNVSTKTAFFLQYKYVDVAYDEAVVNDSEQNFYYGGIKWDTTEKVALLLKAGYQEREFDAAGREEYDGLALDLQATYRYSEKTEMRFALYRMNEETDSTVASDKTVWGANLNYNQKFTEKITGSFNFSFEDADYNQLIAQDRDEQTYSLRPAVQYLFKEWMQAELAYQYEEVDSTDEFFEYRTNTLMLGLNFAL
jgi:hypothetical protein